MAATKTLPQLSQSDKLHIPRHGIVTLFGYGIRVSLSRGHLFIEDGIGAERRQVRLPRVGHGLTRLIVIGSDGIVSLAALRWLADQDAAFVMLDRDGTVLCTTGPVRPSDARLRRAQALAAHTGTDVTIARELISQKLAGQERVAREKLHDETTALQISDHRLALAETETVDSIRSLESQGAAAYWSAWRNLQISFPTKDLPRTPEHWRTFGTRKSPLSGSPRLAVNPPNAMLNYLYSVLESEARLATAALGLDPGLGFIHVDTPARDSLACDLMEAVRPRVDAYVLGWLTQQPLSRSWFFEQRDGNCRLMAPFAVRLSETAPTWAHAVAPFAEWVARQLWSANRKSVRENAPPTRLTQLHKRKARGSALVRAAEPAPRLQNVCRGCGKAIRDGRINCANCAIPTATERLFDAARIGRVVAHSPEARAREGDKQREHAQQRSSWKMTGQWSGISTEAYLAKVQPQLASLPSSIIAKAIEVSRWYAGRIRKGYRPHPRHWAALARLVKLDLRVSG